jgi:hypothetical protein
MILSMKGEAMMQGFLGRACLLSVVLSAGLAGAARGAVVISEIMNDPASSEAYPNASEWIELYNAGDEPVRLAGWYLSDEDGQTKAFGEDVSIDAGATLVVIPAAQDVADFKAAWGDDVAVQPIAGWDRSGLNGLSNSPSQSNEKLTLRDGDDEVIDAVNFDDVDPWPTASEGASIYLLPQHLTAEANDEGEHWRAAEAEKGGAFHAKETSDYSADDVGSPGVVPEKSGEVAAKTTDDGEE